MRGIWRAKFEVHSSLLRLTAARFAFEGTIRTGVHSSFELNVRIDAAVILELAICPLKGTPLATTREPKTSLVAVNARCVSLYCDMSALEARVPAVSSGTVETPIVDVQMLLCSGSDGKALVVSGAGRLLGMAAAEGS